MSELLGRVRHTLYNVLVELISNSDGYWHDWETWTTCNEPCGTSLRFKLRKCVVSHNGGTCDGQPVIVGMCNDLCSGKYNCSANTFLHTLSSRIHGYRRQSLHGYASLTVYLSYVLRHNSIYVIILMQWINSHVYICLGTNKCKVASIVAVHDKCLLNTYFWATPLLGTICVCCISHSRYSLCLLY